MWSILKELIVRGILAKTILRSFGWLTWLLPLGFLLKLIGWPLLAVLGTLAVPVLLLLLLVGLPIFVVLLVGGALLELVPAALAREITAAHPQMMTIGIGAGAGTAGQVLVLHDLLGLTPGRRPRFVRDFTREPGSTADAPGLPISAAVVRYVQDVKAGRFPDEAVHAF